MAYDLPRVSVCIPVYNRALLVCETLRSVLAQDYPRVEILVQDNASDDGTANVLAELARKHPQIAVQRNPALIGMIPNFNRVVARAQGDLVLMLSSDDLLEPGFLRICAEALRDPEIDVVTTGYYWLEGGRKTPRIPKVPGGLYRGALGMVLRENPFNLCVSLFRRSLLERVSRRGKLFRERLFTGDYDLWLRVAAAGAGLLYRDDVLGGCFRLHAGNISKGNRRMYRHTNLTVLANREALRRQCPFTYRYKLARILTHNLRDWVRGRPVDRHLNRAVTLALLER